MKALLLTFGVCSSIIWAGSVDDFEHCGSILHNVSQLDEAREIILDSRRGIFPLLVDQLNAESVVRRRGIAGTIR